MFSAKDVGANNSFMVLFEQRQLGSLVTMENMLRRQPGHSDPACVERA